MCGIAGIFAKNAEVEQSLGGHLSRMLTVLGDRGPDSTGFAVYRAAPDPRTGKLSLRATGGNLDWEAVCESLAWHVGEVEILESSERHAVLAGREDPAVLAEAARHLAGVQILSTGHAIELFKEVGSPEQVSAWFDLPARTGTHALGHTRMATESRVTTEGSHPFSTGPDLCLVHNGSLSNHNRLRAELRYEGIEFQTDNDSEVAAGYLTWRTREGATLEEALRACLEDLDGFYTFAVGTADGFAVLRDPIACKPAVLAETDAWVAMASEYRAIAELPGAEDAQVWEPAPGQVYVWEKEAVA